MSSTVRSYGYIGVLAMPLDEEQREVISEKLYDEGTDLHISYDGTLLYSDASTNKRDDDIYMFVVGVEKNSGTKAQFLAASHVACVPVLSETILPYTEVWYNGADSEVSMLTKDEFEKILKAQP